MSNYERIKNEVRKEIMASRMTCGELVKDISISIVGDALDQLTAAALHEGTQSRKHFIASELQERPHSIKNSNFCHTTIIITEDYLKYADMYVTAVHEILCEEKLSLSVLFVGLHVSLDAIRKIYEENSDTYFYYVFPEKDKTEEDKELEETDIIYYAYPEYIIMNTVEEDDQLLENDYLDESIRREVVIRNIIRSVLLRENGVLIPQFIRSRTLHEAPKGIGFKFKVTSIYAYYTICDAAFAVLSLDELRGLHESMILVSNIVQDRLMEEPYSHYEIGDEEYFGHLYKLSKKLGLLRKFYKALSAVFRGDMFHDGSCLSFLPLNSDTILWMDRQILGERND